MSDYKHPEVLVSTDWVTKNLNSPNVRLVEVDVDTTAYDQGHIPVKLLGFNVDPMTGKWNALSGVNITLGLPIIRTSVDHGTAFDIAGKGIASETSLIEAIDFAVFSQRVTVGAARRIRVGAAGLAKAWRARLQDTEE